MSKILKTLMAAAALTAAAAAYAQQPVDVAKTLSAKCPMDISDGLSLTSVALDDDQFVFIYTISDEMFTNIADLGGLLHDSMLAEMVSSPDQAMRMLIEVCKANKIKIIDRFADSKGNTFDIIILPEEL